MVVCILILAGIIIVYVFLSGRKEEKKERERLDRANAAREQQRMEKRKEMLRSQRNIYELNTALYISKHQEAKKAFLNNSQSLMLVWSSMFASVSCMKQAGQKPEDIPNDIWNEIRKKDVELREMQQEFEKVSGLKIEMERFPDCIMMSLTEYGQANREFFERVRRMTFDDAHALYQKCQNILDNQGKEEKVKEQSPTARMAALYGGTEKQKFVDNPSLSMNYELAEDICACLWFFAMAKPYSVENFNAAEKLCNRYFRGYEIDNVFISELYAANQMGGESVVQGKVRDRIKEFEKAFATEEEAPVKQNSHNIKDRLQILASALMWMQAYLSEKQVLEFMLERGIPMDSKLQERLHSLNNGGGKAPSGFEVESDDQNLYFDVSSLAWRDEEYNGLFENLAFKETDLTYSLAIRDEDKSLMVGQSFSLDDPKIVLEKIQEVFADEYGNAVVSMCKDCIALSGSGEEKISGILSQSKECEQLGIFVHIARIGKKLNIKFYTLFMPTSGDVADQKQQALSMYKKLSPTVTMWEDGLKDTILVAIQQMLNDTPTSDSTTSNFNSNDEEVEF